ncbi:MAG TPA: trypsin-like peptidase domain-containing protein [Blastocatellia bacterium]|nr:trypsin-like peptidase domain-containing protein [Blastocatellia bacterium]
MENRFSDSIKRALRGRILTPALALSLGFGLFASSGSMVFGQQAPEDELASGQQAQKEKATETQATLPSPAELSRAFINVAKRIKPAVVQINIVTSGISQTSADEPDEAQPSDSPSGQPLNQVRQQSPYAKRGTGSGVVITPDGYILTNNHVAGPASEIRVRLYDGREFKARRIGVDPETDLALVKIDAQNLPYATLGDSSKLEQGEWVIALGSPFGLEQTMTAGIVSATGRQFGGTYDNYIQTDASINPGNSGGPLISMNGEVIGINTMIYSRSGGSEGIGFSVPSNTAKKVKEQLLRSGRVSRGYLAVSLQDAQTAGDGATVADVTNGGPASKAGLRNGDRIVEFDGKPVKSTKQLTELIADTPAGTAVKLKYMRDGQEQTASITPAERPGRRVANSPEARDPYGRPPQP